MNTNIISGFGKKIFSNPLYPAIIALALIATGVVLSSVSLIIFAGIIVYSIPFSYFYREIVGV
ncbi:MAG: hypothetical protein LBU43_04590 [Candidatus Accumulibacter sp.]|jgi:hypothetical protein|nr:hypothetical protein [Accumulibacter sp.]